MNRRTVLALGGSAFLAARTSAGAQQPLKMTLGAVPEESVTPALWAEQSGMFLRAGLDVDVQSQGSGTAIAAGVAGGSYAVGKSSLGAIISAHSHGLPFVLVAGGSRYDAKNSYSKLAVKADSPFKTGADLNGKIIAAPALNDLTTIATKAWIDQHGGDSSTVKVLELPFAAIPDALAASRVDAGFIADPVLQQAIDAGKVRVLADAFGAIASQFMITAWFVTADYAAKNREALAKFNRVMTEASAYVEAHPSDAVALLSKFGGVDQAVILKWHRLTYAALEAGFDAKELIAPGLR
jgi:NitT/TauT family transport system substrate-binding protein